MAAIKRNLIQKPITSDAKILAQSLYSTYVSNDYDPYIFEPIDKFYHLFTFEAGDDPLEKLSNIFIDLTEPILLEQFEFNAKQYSNLILTFCSYKIVKHNQQVFLEVEIDERYLEALKHYIIDPFLHID